MERNLLLLLLCMYVLLPTTQSCGSHRRYEKLSRPLYEELKNDEKEKEALCSGMPNMLDHGAVSDMSHQSLMAEIQKCERHEMNMKVGDAFASSIVSYISGTLKIPSFPVSLLFPTSSCSSREFIESIVDGKIAKDHLDKQEAQVRGWNKTHNDISDSAYKTHIRLVVLNDDMKSDYYTFLSSKENIKMTSAVIARDYLNARLLLLTKIVKSTDNCTDNAMYRREALKVMNETVVYIKESVELARRWRYVTSKDKSFSRRAWVYCTGWCDSRGSRSSEWINEFTYDEENYNELFKNVACPIVKLNKGSLPLKRWKEIADWLMAFPEVCTPGKLDCDLILKELGSWTYTMSSSCYAKVQGIGGDMFTIKQPCPNDPNEGLSSPPIHPSFIQPSPSTNCSEYLLNSD